MHKKHQISLLPAKRQGVEGYDAANPKGTELSIYLFIDHSLFIGLYFGK